MNEITAVSQITAQDVADYLRLVDPTQDDFNTLETMLIVAKVFVQNYTGQSMAQLDLLQDVIIAILILCQDMWDNRTLYVECINMNRVVESILDLHSVNLL